MGNLAISYRNLGRHAEALKLYEETLALREGKLGPDHPDIAKPMNGLAWRLANCPDAKFRDPARAVQLASKAVELAPQDGNNWNTLGAARYRAGDWNAAVAALEKSMQLTKGGSSLDWFFLAMAHGRLGEKDEARRRFDEAVKWMAKNQPQDEELRRFRAEAEELLGVKEKNE